MKSKDLINKGNKREILYNIINSLLSGMLVFLGAFSDGDITVKGVIVALIASAAIAVTLFKDYWGTQKKEYVGLFKFI